MSTPTTSSALRWSLFGEVTARLVAPLLFLVLAKLLSPADFGVMAVATLMISLCQTLMEAGLGKGIVQRRDRLEASAHAAFWMNLVLSIVLAGAIVAMAPNIAVFFAEARVADVLRVLSLQLPLAALCTVPAALLQRDLRFKELFHIRLLTTLVPAGMSIPMALQGAGYWALVAAALASQGLQAVGLWRSVAWRPAFSVDRTIAGELAAFGRWALLAALLGWFFAWMDAFVVARFLGVHDVGVYRTSQTLTNMVFGVVFAALLPVFYAAMARVGHDRDAVSRSLTGAADLVMLVAAPAAALLATAAPLIEKSIFGAAWEGLAPVLALLALSQGAAWLIGLNGEAYRAIGRPSLEAWAMGLSTLIYMAGYLWAIQYGLIAFVAMRVLLVVPGILLQVAIAHRALGIVPSRWLRSAARPVVFAVVAWTAAQAVTLDHAVAQATIRLLVVAIVYAALISLLARTDVGRLRRMVNAS